MKSILVFLLCFICLGSAQNSWTTTPAYNENSPSIKLHSGSPDFTGGDSAYLTCELPHDLGDVTFKFWKEDDLLRTSGTNEFTLHNLKQEDSGIYWCSVHRYEKQWKSVNTVIITVRGYQSRTTDSHGSTVYRTPTPSAMSIRRPTLVLHQPKEYYYEGAGIHFTCQTDGYEDESKFNFGLMQDGRYVSQQEGREFYLYNLRSSDAGRYSCAIFTYGEVVGSHNTVYIYIVKSSGDGDGGYTSSGPSRYTFPHTVLIISLILAMMGFQA